jgi:membrane protease subunit (stomatin/prohibitin family)
MTLWEKAKAELIDIVEWTDDSTDTMVWRFPGYENEIKHGGQLLVRQSQAAVFVNMGKIADVFASGRHRLVTENLPVLATLMGWKYGFHSPFKAEVYFVNTRNFTNLKWGTKNPVILRDPEFGPVRLRSFGTYVVRVCDPAKFIKEIVGTGGHFTLNEVSDQLKNLIVTRFSEYGLEVTKLLVENISLPLEVEEVLDKKSSMGVIGNLENYFKFQSANAMEAAAKNPGGDASAGVGMGMGFAMANQFGKMTAPSRGPLQNDGQPPPLPQEETDTKYYVGKNGKQAGPFEKKTIIGYMKKGAITPNTLLWKAGMESWKPAELFSEFEAALKTAPPPLPE